MAIEKRETELKLKLTKYLRSKLPGYIIFRHEDVRSSGIPDYSVTFAQQTTWLEVKHATPDFESPGLQELTMLRLAGHGSSALYVVFEETREKGTYIVAPRSIGRWHNAFSRFSTGHDFELVAAELRYIHEG